MSRLLIQFATALTLLIVPAVALASPLVSPAWLSENLDDTKLVIVDIRNKIDEGSYETFLEGHIPGAIHSDFEKHFIRAEVISYQDYIDHNGEQGAKAKGLWRLEGKDYVVQDGDILEIRHSAK